MSDKSPSPITQVVECEVYRNQFVTVFDDEVVLGNGDPGRHLRIVSGDGKPGVAILALSGQRVALVRTYRYTLGRWDWGIPRGFGHIADPAVSARAELVEELGAEPSELLPLTSMTPDSGLLASTVEVFVARYAQPISAPLDTAEVAEVRWVSIAEFLTGIAVGTFTDGFTLAAAGAAIAKGILTPPVG